MLRTLRHHGARTRPTAFRAVAGASNSIHPDQHAIVINPGNPTQIFEGSDGGVIRTNGAFADISSQCDERGRDGALAVR